MKNLVYLLLALSIAACGEAGPQGQPGASGAPGFNGKDGKDGANGQNGAPGSTGPQGPQGTQGDPGANGLNGADGTQIQVIQFCSDAVPSYPATFPEVGVCINNQIFAVYSTNGGFLALLTPGTYNSNAVGSNCNFTVQANCVVVH